VTFFLALDEPLLKAFGPWLTDVLRKLGLKEAEAIESGLVLRRVRQARAWYERRVSGDGPADTAEE
jgi:preprotein translocase subunit SecA